MNLLTLSRTVRKDCYMTNYEIITDGALNVHPSLVDPSDFRMIPMVVSMNDDDFLIGEGTPSETIQAFYRGIRDSLATTSQIPLSIYEAYFQKILAQGKDIIYFSLSSGISATYTQALLAKKSLANSFPNRSVVCIDTKNCGPAGTFLVKRAVANRARGLSLQENEKDLKHYLERVVFTGLITHLDHLRRSGRASGGMALLGSALNIKPILLMTDAGDLIVSDKARGTKQAAKRLVKILQDAMDPEETTVLLSHGDDEALALTVKETILEKTPATEVYVDILTPVVSAHIGQGALGMSFIQKIAH